MPGLAVMDGRHMCRPQHRAHFGFARKSQIVAYGQWLDDVDRIFVLHFDIAGCRQRFLQHGRPRTAARNHKESLGFDAHGLTAMTIASRPKPAFAKVR